MQLHSSLRHDFGLHAVDTSKRQLRWAVERPTWRTPLYFLRDITRLVRALARVRPHAVLVHAAPSLSFLRDWVLMATSRLSGANVICHYHGSVHMHFPSCETPRGTMLGRFLMRAAHQVVVLGPTYQTQMGDAWHRTLAWSPTRAMSGSIVPSLLTSLRRGSRPASAASLFVGRLSAPKGIYDLIEAIPRVIERHSDARFVLAGVAESDAMEPVIRAEADKRGIAHCITFLGSVEGRDKAAAYAACEMLVVPSWTEAFPLVIPEAMAAGLPVIATAVGAIPDFVTDGEDGFLVPPRDPVALADRISRLLEDEYLRRRIGERVRERAPNEFAIEVGSVKMASIVRSVLEER
jgi:glycosyltransferase involved in cell wall biosynthesis